MQLNVITDQKWRAYKCLFQFPVVWRKLCRFSFTPWGYPWFLCMKQLRVLQGLPLSTTLPVLLLHVKLRKNLLFFFSEPSTAPSEIVLQSLNETTYNISWDRLTREESNGEVLAYEVKYTRMKQAGASSLSALRYQNTTDTVVTLQGLTLCSTYHAQVRAYTSVGAGPFSRAIIINTTGR